MKRLAVVLLLLNACGSAEDGDQLGSRGSGGAPANPANAPTPLGRERCRAGSATGSPQSIDQAVSLLNALPKPTSVACFIESLDRPLFAFATNSPFSAQPALSTRSPRVFIKTGDLWSSVVIDGDSSQLIEFGHLLPGTMRSIKGEVKLPLEAPLAPSAPFDRVRYAEGTACSLCHFHEQQETLPGVSGAFSSVAFKPRADTYVSLEGLRAEARACDWKAEPHRCEMLSALFDGGTVVESAFPDSMETFF